MSASPGGPRAPSPNSPGHHLATISHEGRFWEVYLQFAEARDEVDAVRAALCFVPADMNEGEEGVRTGTIIIESSSQEALARARSLEERQLGGLLRSCLPD